MPVSLHFGASAADWYLLHYEGTLGIAVSLRC
jgi:hypothetical protein